MRRRDLAVVLELFLRAATLERRRAVLTVAAIAWGTVAILMLLSFGEGLKRQIMRGQRGMGENIAVWWPGETSRVWEGLPSGRPIRPRVDDIPYLRQRMTAAVGVIGELSSFQTTLTYGTKTVTARVTGVNWEYGELRNHYPRPGGRFLDRLDEEGKRRVIFLGDKLATTIFGSEEPVGRTLLVNSAPYLVVGVMQKKLQMGAYKGPDDDHAVIPISTYAAQLGEQKLSNVVFKVARPQDMPLARSQFGEALSARYRFDPTDKQVVDLWDTVEGGRVMDQIMIGIQAFLGIVGGLTLLVGGVGVANIMYAVVKEKTREIGVKMALGARAGWITAPFVLQGLAYTLLGGAAGAGLGVLFIALLELVPVEGNQALELLGKPTLSWPIAAVTAAVLGAVGIAAGYFPARRAARIDPAQTLRYE